MIYKVKDQQHFQVLSDSFSVSPSETGYELYFSANGIDFSPFTTVAAGQNKQFVNMSNGNYYYLSGNVGTVEVNWERNCGGGGGGTAGVSSLDGQTGALTTKTINGNAILGSGDITISGGTGSEVSFSQTLSAGTEIGQITIDGSATTIYAPEGGSGAKTYVLNLMTQAERVTLFEEIASAYSGGSYDTISSGFPVSSYQFYYYFESVDDDGSGFIPLRITRVSPQIVIRFEGIRNGYAARTFKELTLECSFDGNIIVDETAPVEVSYNRFDGGLSYDPSTDKFASNGSVLSADTVYNNIINWGTLAFCHSGESGISTRYLPNYYLRIAPPVILDYTGISDLSNPSIKLENISAVTIGGVEFTTLATFDYGEWVVSFYINGNNLCANFKMYHRKKVDALSQSDYDALVQAGTVDANTLYIII